MERQIANELGSYVVVHQDRAKAARSPPPTPATRRLSMVRGMPLDPLAGGASSSYQPPRSVSSSYAPVKGCKTRYCTHDYTFTSITRCTTTLHYIIVHISAVQQLMFRYILEDHLNQANTTNSMGLVGQGNQRVPTVELRPDLDCHRQHPPGEQWQY